MSKTANENLPRIRVLMVCLGNICRSPLAEGVLKELVKSRGVAHRFLIDSAGTADYHVGDPPDRRSVRIARQHGFELEHVGRQFCEQDLENFDYILTMDRFNFQNAIRLARSDPHRAKIQMLDARDVADPYYGGLDEFEACYQHLQTALDRFLTRLLSQV